MILKCEILSSTIFILTYCVNNKVVNKSDFLLPEENKIKVKINFKTKYLIMGALNTREYFYVFNCISIKKVWETL